MHAPPLQRHARSVIVQGMSRIGPSMHIPAVLAELGVDPVAFLAEFGLDPAFFDEPEHTLPMATLAAIAGRGAERTGCEHFGLLVGKRATLSSFGTIGFLMQSAPTVGAAIGLLHRHYQLQSRGAEVTAENEGGYITLSYAMLDRSIGHVAQIDSASVAIGVNILRALTAPDWEPHAVRFAFSAPKDLAPYRKFFRTMPRFDADRSALVFPARLLERAVPTADPLLYRMMEDRALEMLASANEDLSDHVRRILRQLVTSADCSAERIALAMGMHVRTLNRSLAAEGTTFLELRETIRFEEACRLLRDTRMRAGEVAATLGYADASSFTRAFRRWSGVGPSHWRIHRAALAADD